MNQLAIDRVLQATCIAQAEHHTQLSSTQDRVQAIAQETATANLRLPLLIVADQQTSGRGRGGNAWWTGHGSLAFSLLFEPAFFGLDKKPIPQASLAASVAVIDAVSAWVGEHIIGLHWPNDVFVADRKLAGILIDVLPDGRHLLGLGLNVNNSVAAAPEEVRVRATSLLQLAGHELNRTDVLIAVLNALESAMRQLARHPETLGQRFDELCLQIGRELTIESAARQTTGRCAGIAPDGALLLDTLSGRQMFYSGVLR